MEIGSKFYFSIHVNTKKKGQIRQKWGVFEQFAPQKKSLEILNLTGREII